MRTEAAVSKWGNSLAVRIPQGLAKQAQISEGDNVTMDLQNDGSIVLRPSRPKYDLSELVSKITPKNRHQETDWGPSVGKEQW